MCADYTQKDPSQWNWTREWPSLVKLCHWWEPPSRWISIRNLEPEFIGQAESSQPSPQYERQ